jgi:heptosyltransferase-2
MKVAVVKPDHLGDFILALPAIRALRADGHDVTLFIASGNKALASYYFPDVEQVAVDMPYLKRGGDGDWNAVYRALGRLREYDIVVFLRNDQFLQHENYRNWTDYGFQIEARDDRHQTQLERAVVRQIAGDYDIEDLFYTRAPSRFATSPTSVVFAVGTGFPFKKWSPLAWAELAQAYLARGVAVRLLAGPAEVAECQLIARAAGLDAQRDIFVGGSDFAALDQWLAQSDYTIAVDGGSAHLCSVTMPVVSVFGPSPARRFCPTGSYNRVISRELKCHPCVGFDARALNACLSRECMLGLRAAHVLEGCALPAALPGTSAPLGGGAAILRFGFSVAETFA